MNLSTLSLTETRGLLRAGELDASDLTEACYRQIERLNPILNAFITVIPNEKPAAPHSSTSETVNSQLRDIPIALKDLYETRGIRTTGGSRFFANYIPTEDAYVVKKLREAGAWILGKTNTHEIALGVTTDNPHYGACRNPWDTRRTPGGSSGGSAAAVAAGMAIAALGTDTGGSIRIPASLCGVTGIKPTFGRVSLRGVMPLSWNLDHAGPLTRTVEDAAIVLQAIATYDSLDPACVKMLPGDYLSHLTDGVSGRHIALAVGEYVEEAKPEVLEAVRTAAEVFKDLGAEIIEVDLTWLREAALANGLMTQADAAAYHRERLRDHPDWFGADVRQRLEAGAALTSSEYSLARRTQAEVRRGCDALFESYDILLLPTTPIPAPFLDGEDAIERARTLTRFTAPFNLSGLPALSIPCGFTKEGLPIGLQIVSRAWNEAGVLRAGHAYQLMTDWHEKRPELASTS
jgi:aspartyl-tRNA(Asn)/glutamyl-tRNA(Gln) amidotransferase subunit A